MSEVAAAARWARVVLHGLSSASHVYQLEADGRRVYRGVRPGPGWQGHGTFARKLWTLVDGALVQIVVHKQRWRLSGTRRTCHSRPPDDLASVWFCSLVVATALWGWLRGDDGLHRHEPQSPALLKRPPLAAERLERVEGGRVRLRLKREFSDGTWAIEMDELSLCARLAALVPTIPSECTWCETFTRAADGHDADPPAARPRA